MWIELFPISSICVGSVSAAETLDEDNKGVVK